MAQALLLKTAMFYQLWRNLTLLSFGVFILFVLYSSKKSVCIDSRLVDKIDRVSVSSKDQVFSCSANQSITYTSFWREKVQALNDRIRQVEVYLGSFGPVAANLQIIVFENKKGLFREQGPYVYISDEYFHKKGWLERVLIRQWLRTQAATTPWPLVEDLMVENLLYSLVGKSEYPNYETKSENKKMILWPQQVRSSTDICRFSKKITDQLSFCLPYSEDPYMDQLQDFVMQSWLSAYENLSFFERQKVLSSLMTWYATSFSKEIKSIENLKTSREIISQLVSRLKANEFFNQSPEGLKFVIEISKLIENKGIERFVVEPLSDLVFVAMTEKANDYSFAKNLNKMSTENKNLKIGLIQDKVLVDVKTGLAQPLSATQSWKTRSLVLFTCEPLTFKAISQYRDRAERLLLIRECEGNAELRFEGYLKTGAKGFALQNPTVSFVHFHIPSLMMKKDQLDDEKDIFKQLMQDTKNKVPLHETFGWRQVEWDKDSQAYQPKAYIDAIDLFRTPAQL